MKQVQFGLTKVAVPETHTEAKVGRALYCPEHGLMCPEDWQRFAALMDAAEQLALRDPFGPRVRR